MARTVNDGVRVREGIGDRLCGEDNPGSLFILSNSAWRFSEGDLDNGDLEDDGPDISILDDGDLGDNGDLGDGDLKVSDLGGGDKGPRAGLLFLNEKAASSSKSSFPRTVA